jgi:hypothetical protein
MFKLFERAFQTFERMLRAQLDDARDTDIPIDKVILVGGFGDSPVLKTVLANFMVAYNRTHNAHTKVKTSSYSLSATGVAIGALIGAQDKNNGSKRIPQCSIGFIHHIQADDTSYPAEVMKQEAKAAKGSKERYIRDTIL